MEGRATPITGQANGLYMTALVSNLSATPTFKFDGSAAANLKLAGGFAGVDEFPGISTDFHLGWQLSSSAPATANAPTVSFDNVSLTLGTFLSGVVRPILTQIVESTEPLKPVLEVLNYPLPGLSDMSHIAGGGDITLIDLAGVGAEVTGYGPLFDLAHKAEELLLRLSTVENLAGNISVPLGGFDLSGTDLRTKLPAGDISDLNLTDLTDLLPGVVNYGAGVFNDFVGTLPSELQGFMSEVTAGLNNGFSIEFPILDNPEQAIFGMLLGRDSDLVYLKADADVTAHGSQATGLSIFGVGVNYVSDLHINMHFKFAYDTFGVRELINHLANGETGDILSDITDGFYIDSGSRFEINGGIGAEAGIALGLFDFEVDGGIFTGDHGAEPLVISIVDPSGDNKLRFSEFDEGLKLTGELDGDLGVDIRIGTEILGEFFGIEKRFDIVHERIVYFGSNDPPVLASQPDANGEITLYLGQYATQRHGYGLDNPVDGDESFIIRHLRDNADGSEDIKIVAFGVSQEIHGVRKMNAFDVLGTLNINVMPEVTSDVHFEGGQGAANMTYLGTGFAYLEAGDLASTLVGGYGMNHLVGLGANDTLLGGKGSNQLDGGDGDDTIILGARKYGVRRQRAQHYRHRIADLPGRNGCCGDRREQHAASSRLARNGGDQRHSDGRRD